MLEYVFFDRRPYQRFLQFVRDHGLEPVCREDGDNFEVGLPEDLEEDLGECIEAFYDEMMDFNRALHDSDVEQSGDNYQAAGVVVDLQDGRTVYADVDPALLARVMAVLTPQEFGTVVDAIVAAVEHPDTRTFCQRMRDLD